MRYYKVIAIKIDTLCSEIIDERHFAHVSDARSYSSSMLHAGYTTILVDMSTSNVVR